MPIDEKPSGPVTGPIKSAPKPRGGKNPPLDAPPRVCSTDEVLAVDHEARRKRRETAELEDAFDPEFDELPDAWNWQD